MPIFSEDDGNYNILPEGFGTHTKFLGDVSNATRSYIRDKANEQAPTRQVYLCPPALQTLVPRTCSAFDVDIVNNGLAITENTNNELGGKCTVTLGLADNGAENQDAETFDVVFSVAPVNDAPVILDWNRTTETVMVADNGSIRSPVVHLLDGRRREPGQPDLRHVRHQGRRRPRDGRPVLDVESTDQCVYTNYFTTTIEGDNLVFDLIEDATTNANDWEIDYLNNNGIHQIGPSGSGTVRSAWSSETPQWLQPRKASTAPTCPTTTQRDADRDYQQAWQRRKLVFVLRTSENWSRLLLHDVHGFNFNGITNVMTGTYVPVPSPSTAVETKVHTATTTCWPSPTTRTVMRMSADSLLRCARLRCKREVHRGRLHHSGHHPCVD